MINKLTCLVALLMLTCLPVFAQTSSKLHAEFYTGYEQENFHWSIAGNSTGTSPNIYSELKWKVSGLNTGAALSWNFWKGFEASAQYNITAIQAGHVNDSDYQDDNRSNNIYNETFAADKGSIQNASVQLGYIFKVRRLSVKPFGGYTLNNQNLYILGNTTSDLSTLHTTYKTTWKGALVGITVNAPLTNKISLEPTLIYNQVNYNSRADWNQILDFEHPVSFRQNANGFGLQSRLKINYQISSLVTVFISGNYQHWETGNGVDRLFRINGDRPETQFNGAARNTWGVNTGLNIRF
ncbi:hypothetical protein [Mucilaginibacter sp. KACC 22063]|uniref:hypothetical protein n=1 Tax=Mucilaginibacter sp. KACC 22063 TaxID=3025666 RepID=UPI0023652997|nr:hypothetical protein [Mucilaginibacter sp. KACC 22063]WDF55480.1 hypothetical protein PQ461_00215 [Mucilaginibacter sp. KACC 22063]